MGIKDYNSILDQKYKKIEKLQLSKDYNFTLRNLLF